MKRELARSEFTGKLLEDIPTEIVSTCCTEGMCTEFSSPSSECLWSRDTPDAGVGGWLGGALFCITYVQPKAETAEAQTIWAVYEEK